jgi:hypothetical protein
LRGRPAAARDGRPRDLGHAPPQLEIDRPAIPIHQLKSHDALMGVEHSGAVRVTTSWLRLLSTLRRATLLEREGNRRGKDSPVAEQPANQGRPIHRLRSVGPARAPLRF